MKLIEFRDSMHKGKLGGALIIALMPIFGLLTGTAISMGYYGVNYHEVSMSNNPDQYWFIINWEFTVVFCMVLLSKLEFPLLEVVYQRILLFRNAHKYIAYIILYLIIPLFVVAFLLLLLFLFDL